MTENNVRIVIMQQTPMVSEIALPRGISPTLLEELDTNQKAQAERELAQAFADGYEIADVSIGSHDNALMTVWTLRRTLVRPRPETDTSVVIDPTRSLSTLKHE